MSSCVSVSSTIMFTVRNSVILVFLLFLSVSNGQNNGPTFRERAMYIARRISRYQEQLAEFAKTVQNVNLVSMTSYRYYTIAASFILKNY